MERLIKQDPFFADQPPMLFIDELKTPLHKSSSVSELFGKVEPSNSQTNISGAYLDIDFEDNVKLLETAYTDFNYFLEIYKIAGNRYPIKIKHGKTVCFEAYTVNIQPKFTEITAADTEGIRRALVWIEDRIRSNEGAYLDIGEVKRQPYIRSRITRCFFSPINRPPKYGDELSDDIDYYPEEYLNRLAHDGANGVWIYTRFSDIIPSSYIIENGKNYEKLIDKLNRVIAKCARYGIKVYIFAIEPVALDASLSQKYPELRGSKLPGGAYTFCTYTEMGRKFCQEATERMFTLCPDLGGYISITYGERTTSCASLYNENNCPHCKDIPIGQVLSNTADALREGMRKVKPQADFISWTYGHRLWNFDDIRDYVKSVPNDVMLMQNFDDMGYEEQLGVMRQCVDYWLSYVGPSELFEITAKQAKISGKHIFAKMQVCCSHEVASVPYIPVPGILYDKNKGARALGVEGVMQCWYFGNYPSLMSKAAGELAFTDAFDDKNAFLTNLAAIYWGKTKASIVAEAWELFEKSYRNYPMNVMFSYYGPMHDGPVWELQLKPKNFSLPRTWQTLDPTDGDRISECLLNGHTLDEAIILVEDMSKNWNEGYKIISELNCENNDEIEQLSIIKTLRILFDSGKNILKFYLLRDNLGKGNTNLLPMMENIVRNEINNSKDLIQLCENDGRLGYHSEGEGYKFFPKKLRHRINQLENLLNVNGEFAEVKERIEKNLPPLDYYMGIESGSKSYNMSSNNWEVFGGSMFKITYDSDNLYIELKNKQKVSFTITPEFKLMWSDCTFIVDSKGKVDLGWASLMYNSIFGEREKAEYSKYKNVEIIPSEGTHIKLKINRLQVGIDELRPMKIRLRSSAGDMWCTESDPIVTLGKPELSPGEFGWLIP